MPSPAYDGGGWAIISDVEPGDGTAVDMSLPGHAVHELQLADNDRGEVLVKSVRLNFPASTQPIALWG